MSGMARSQNPAAAITALVFGAWLALAASPCLAQQAGASQQSAAKRTRVVGVVKAVNGNTITLATDAGPEINVILQPATRLMRLEPGQTDLKSATAIQWSDVRVGDRMLAGGTASGDGKSVTATSAVIMKKSDVAEKQEQERQEWERNGVGGIVKLVDSAAGTITLSAGPLGTSALTVHVSKDTIIRRYAPDSVKFDDAKPGTLEQIKAGDQLRARGTKSADGREMTAAEIVSGTFRSIAATVISTDAANHAITVMDLARKRPVTLRVTADSQMHELPQMFAMRIAMRLKAAAAGASADASGGHAMPVQHARPTLLPEGEQGGAAAGGFAHGARPGGPDFQQILNRLPGVELSQLRKGDAVMIVATLGSAGSPSQVIILLSGVEPILTAASPSAASTILSPWNLSSGGSVGTAEAP